MITWSRPPAETNVCIGTSYRRRVQPHTSGYSTDGDAGLMHVGARYYDAQVGRFLTRDTVLWEHPYLYCEHDPVNAVDPSGHLAWWELVIDWLGDRGDEVVRWLPGGPAAVSARSCLIEIVIGGAAILVVWRFAKRWNTINPPGTWGGNPDDRHRGGKIPIPGGENGSYTYSRSDEADDWVWRIGR